MSQKKQCFGKVLFFTCRSLPPRVNCYLFTPVNGDLENLERSGRHRPQRCRQTDRKAGEAAAHVQAVTYGKRLKAVAADYCQLLNSPSTWKETSRSPMKTQPVTPPQRRNAEKPFTIVGGLNK